MTSVTTGGECKTRYNTDGVCCEAKRGRIESAIMLCTGGVRHAVEEIEHCAGKKSDARHLSDQAQMA